MVSLVGLELVKVEDTCLMKASNIWTQQSHTWLPLVSSLLCRQFGFVWPYWIGPFQFPALSGSDCPGYKELWSTVTPQHGSQQTELHLCWVQEGWKVRMRFCCSPSLRVSPATALLTALSMQTYLLSTQGTSCIASAQDLCCSGQDDKGEQFLVLDCVTLSTQN